MHSTDNVQTIAIVVQTIAIVISVLVLFYQLRRDWRFHSAEMVTNLVAQFYSKEFEERRRSLAAHLEPVIAGKPVSLPEADAFEVLSFYENLAYLVRRGALDRLMVWNAFSWGLVCYFQCMTLNDNALRRLREKYNDQTFFEEIQWLNGKFIKIYGRRRVPVYGEDGKVRWLETFFAHEKGCGVNSSGGRGRPGSRALG